MKNDVVRSFGHPLHASMVHIPLGLLLLAPLWDVIGMSSGNLVWWQIGFWTTLVGVVVAVPVALVGLMDLVRATAGPARSTGIAHMLWNLGGVAAFIVALILRRSSIIAPVDETPVLIADLVGFVALGVAGWLGGQLVFLHGVGQRASAPASTPSTLPTSPPSASTPAANAHRERAA